jgi:hypothetical protein
MLGQSINLLHPDGSVNEARYPEERMTAYVVDAVTVTVLVCARIFAVGRTVQSAVHLSYNNPNHRVGVFSLSFLGLMVMWGALAANILGRI